MSSKRKPLTEEQAHKALDRLNYSPQTFNPHQMTTGLQMLCFPHELHPKLLTFVQSWLKRQMRDLRTRDDVLVRLIREEKNPQKLAELRKSHREVMDRIEVLDERGI